MNEARQYCSFYVAGLYFGVDVRDVQEVIRYQEMTRVPLAASEVAGLINLRGQIVTAIDLRKRFGMPDREANQLPTNVVVRIGDCAASLLVDEVGEVLNVEAEAFERPPETLPNGAAELISGVYKLKDRLLLTLDTDKTVSVSSAAA